MTIDKNMNVLIVDDFTTMRRVLTNMLNHLGFNNVFEADDGVNAVTLLENEKIDFIISDWNMPRMKGIELLQHIRQADELKGIPFLMVTAEGSSQIIEAVKAKVSRYIFKPFTVEQLNEKIEQIFVST